MEYIIIFAFSAFGVLFHVWQTIIDLGNQFKDKTRKEIISIFFKEEWDSLGLSVCIAGFLLLVHYVIHTYLPSAVAWQYFEVFYFGVALIMGYTGQRLLYKWLGSAADALDKKVDTVLNK